MNLTIDLTPLTGKAAAGAPQIASESPETALSGGFAALLGVVAPPAVKVDEAGEDAAQAASPQTDPAKTGKTLPPMTGKNLPLAKELPPVAVPETPAATPEFVEAVPVTPVRTTPVPTLPIADKPAPARPVPTAPDAVEVEATPEAPRVIVPVTSPVTGPVAAPLASPIVTTPTSTAEAIVTVPRPPVTRPDGKRLGQIAKSDPSPEQPKTAATPASQKPSPAPELSLVSAAPAKPQAEFALQLGQTRQPAIEPRLTVAEALQPRQAAPEARAADVRIPMAAAQAAVPRPTQPAELLQNTPTIEGKPALLTKAMIAPVMRETGDAVRVQPAIVATEDEQVDAPQSTTRTAPAATTSPATVSNTAAPAPIPTNPVPTNPIPAEAQRMAMAPQTAAEPAMPARHDFESIVDKLVEARELARPGRADLQMAHREFGRVSVQFEMAGQSLKVALASDDAAFAPSLRAALVERPIAALSEPIRTDIPAARQDSAAQQQAWQSGSQANSQAGSQGSLHADQQRQDQHSRTANGRPQTEQSLRQQSGSGEQSAQSPRRWRDGDRFA